MATVLQFPSLGGDEDESGNIDEDEEGVSSTTMESLDSKCQGLDEAVPADDYILRLREALLRSGSHKHDILAHHEAHASDFLLEVGALLARLRLMARMQPSEVALKSGLALSTVCRNESGQFQLGPRIGSLQKHLKAVRGHKRMAFCLTGLTQDVRLAIQREGMPKLRICTEADPAELSANLVRNIRHISDKHQNEIEARLKKPAGFISKIERGVLSNGVTLKTLHLIASGSDVHLSVVDGEHIQWDE